MEGQMSITETTRDIFAGEGACVCVCVYASSQYIWSPHLDCGGVRNAGSCLQH